MTPLALAAVQLLAAAKKTTSSSSSYFLIFLVVIAVGAYFLFLRPQQQKQRKARQMQSDVHVGDEVMTVGGIRGEIVAMDDQHVTIVTGHYPVGGEPAGEQHRIVLVRNAIARKVDSPVAGSEPDDDDEYEEYTDDDEAGDADDAHDDGVHGDGTRSDGARGGTGP